MANMFSGNQEKKIPKNFKECYETDNVTQNLWGWCEWLEKWGKILFWVLIVGGLILSISTSIVEKEVVVREATYWGEAETELRKTFDFEIFIPLLLETALYAFLEYCTYHVIALLVGSLASIVQNTKISANVALYQAWLSNEGSEEDSPTDTNINIENTASSKRDASTYTSAKNVWICKNCGQKNANTRTNCLKCGDEK